MREIKFRGKRVDKGEWVYGDLFKSFCEDKAFINPTNCLNMDEYDFREVDKETIGQFTGLFDKNGKEIYEGDIVRNNKNTLLLKTGYVKLVNGSYLLLDEEDDDFDFISNWCIEKESYIIGNIHDDKDLLK